MLRFVTKTLLWLIGIILVLAALGTLGGWLFSAPILPQTQEKMTKSPQFSGKAFVNVEPQADTEITIDALKTAFASHPRTNPIGTIPIVPISKERLQNSPQPGLKMAWIGHATVLVEIDGQRILTDPVFSDRTSPFSFLGPRRFHPTPIPLDQLSGIDGVVITHNHYDHLDKATVKHLSKQGTRFFVPLGNKGQLLAWDVPDQQVQEMDWWEEANLGSLKIVATPSRHYSNRGTFDFKKTLWASWSIIGPQNRVFVSGDSGYSKLFSEIGQRFGPFDATIIKIGAYGPGQSWKDVHMEPDQSIKVHQDVRGKALLPVHWGTFNLAYHPWDEPIIRAVEAAKNADVKILTPKPGAFVDSLSNAPVTAWWKTVDQ